MTFTNIISAIGNNSSVYPLIVRDCFIEAPSKILIARKENMKESKQLANDATREKFLDEYITSAIWLGGIPATEYFMDKYISKKGYNPQVSLKLFKEDKKVKTGEKIFQGIEYNIKKFGAYTQKDVQEAILDLVKIKNNKSAFEQLLTKKFAAATLIPTAIMGFILPPSIYALTRKIRAKREKQTTQVQTLSPKLSFDGSFAKTPSFTGANFVSTIANLRTVDKMAISDGGLTIGRVSTSRNKDEAYMNAFRMIGSMILNFVTPVYIAKALNKFVDKTFKINVDLDPKILSDKEFLLGIKNNNIELPKSNNAEDLFDFIDQKPDSYFSKAAEKMKKVSYLKSRIRDPRKFVDVEDLVKFKTEFETFIKNAQKSKNIENLAQKAKTVKGFNILANVGISSFLLAGVLPKMQYRFNKLVTGSYSDPGLRKNL
jgi:hypothetical protein